MNPTIKLVRITTVPMSLHLLLRGQMKFMVGKGFEVHMISAAGNQLDELERRESATHHIVPLTRKISPFTDLYCLIRLVVLLRKLEPHIVHTHTPKAGLLGIWAAFIAGVPVRIHSIAGLPWMEKGGFAKWLLITVEKLTAWPANRIIVNSKYIMTLMDRKKIGSGKLKLLGNGSSNGIDTSYFTRYFMEEGALRAWRYQQGALPDHWVWLFVGRVVKDKGIVELVDAFLQMADEFPADQLWLVGPFEQDLDPIPDGCLEKIKQHPNIRCFGFQEDVRPFMASSNALVFPSYREGFPNVPMQAAAMQLPLLLSDINGCNELVTHGENGFLFESKSVKALFDAMHFGRTNPQALNQWKQEALKRIHLMYNQETIWQSIHTEYQQLLAEKISQPYVPVGH